MTDSLILARTFKKQHKDVLRRLETLGSSKEFNESNFSLVSYFDKKGESRKMYKMTRDGWVVDCELR